MLCTVKTACVLDKSYYCIYIQFNCFQAQSMNNIPHAIPSESSRFIHTVRLDLRARGYDLRTIQKLLGRSDVKTTEIYTHVLGRGAMGVISPLDS